MVSPAMAAAAAITGYLTDVRKFLGAKVDENAPVIKVLNAADFWTDAPTAAPEPQPLVTVGSEAANVELPPATTPSAANKFTVLKGIAARLDIDNIDTDMIIPKQFLKTLKRTGLANALFFTLRRNPNTGEETDFLLNRSPFDKSKIIICTGDNFGCGSSREHAPWSL